MYLYEYAESSAFFQVEYAWRWPVWAWQMEWITKIVWDIAKQNKKICVINRLEFWLDSPLRIWSSENLSSWWSYFNKQWEMRSINSIWFDIKCTKNQNIAPILSAKAFEEYWISYYDWFSCSRIHFFCSLYVRKSS